MNKMVMAAALGVMVAAQPALAVTVTKTTPKPTLIYKSGLFEKPSWTTAQVFQDFDKTLPKTIVKFTEKKTGDVSTYTKGGQNYLEVGGYGTYQVNFTGTPMQYLSFNIWSFSSDDTVKLGFANGTSKTYLGGELFGQAYNQGLSTSGRVNFDMGGQSGIASILFTNGGSNCDPFFLDSFAGAVPEPGTWSMMILGLGLTGASLRRRRKTTIAFA